MTTRIFALVILVLTCTTARADPEECNDSIEQYNNALNEVSSRITRYRNCVADSSGHDDCWTEFRRLKSAHEGFESAASDYKSNCE